MSHRVGPPSNPDDHQPTSPKKKGIKVVWMNKHLQLPMAAPGLWMLGNWAIDLVSDQISLFYPNKLLLCSHNS